jgi:hypothetical protein
MYKTDDGRESFWCKAPPGSQLVMVGADPETFFIPPCVSHQGWVGMRLGGARDWREVEEVVKRSYRLVAPKRFAELSVKGGRISTSVPKRWLTFPAFESSKPFQPKQRPISSIDFGAMAAPSYRSSLSRASRSSDMQCSRGCRRLAMLSVSGRLPFWHRIAGGVSLRCSSERVYPVQKPTVGRASLSWEIPTYYQRLGFDPSRAMGFSSSYAGPHLMGLALHANGPSPLIASPSSKPLE